MNIDQAIQFIQSTRKLGSKLGLQNIKNLMGLLGDPQKTLSFVHVAGTNGKGSTCIFIANILEEAGYKVGLFTSPDIEHYHERFQINQQKINNDDLVRTVEKVKKAVEQMLEKKMSHPTEFELNTAIALSYFKEQKCDCVVWETGLGGRLDSTNVIDENVASVITSIDFDHMHILGNTLEQIAYEKAGIIKEMCDVVLYDDNEQGAKKVIYNRAKELKSNLIETDFSKIQERVVNDKGQWFSYKEFKQLHIKLFGEHQLKNATLALETTLLIQKRYPKITHEVIHRGLEKARWPGRFEILHRNPIVVCDGAHNVQAVMQLKETLHRVFPNQKVIFLMGVMKDKSYEVMTKIMMKDAKAGISTKIDYDRMLNPELLQQEMAKYCKRTFKSDTIERGMDIAFDLAKQNDVICCFGSLYNISEIKKYMREKFHEL